MEKASCSLRRCTTDLLFGQLVDFNSLFFLAASSSRAGVLYPLSVPSLVCSGSAGLLTVSHAGGCKVWVPRGGWCEGQGQCEHSPATSASLSCMSPSQGMPILLPENTCYKKSPLSRKIGTMKQKRIWESHWYLRKSLVLAITIC